MDENAVEAVVPHPAEVAADGERMTGGEEVSGQAGEGHAGDLAAFFRAEFAEVWVEIDGEVFGVGTPQDPRVPRPLPSEGQVNQP